MVGRTALGVGGGGRHNGPPRRGRNRTSDYGLCATGPGGITECYPSSGVCSNLRPCAWGMGGWTGGCAPPLPKCPPPTASAMDSNGSEAFTPLCDIPSGCCSFTGPWTVTRYSLRMLRRVAAFCRPLRPVLLLVSFPRLRSPVVGVLGLRWTWHGVPFVFQRRPIIGVLRMCWLLPGSFDCFCCPHTSVHRPSIACLAVFLCGPGALFLHVLSGPSTICPFPPHGWSAPDGLPLLLRKQPIWAAGDTPHLMPVEQGLPWHPVATPPPPTPHPPPPNPRAPAPQAPAPRAPAPPPPVLPGPLDRCGGALGPGAVPRPHIFV